MDAFFITISILFVLTGPVALGLAIAATRRASALRREVADLRDALVAGGEAAVERPATAAQPSPGRAPVYEAEPGRRSRRASIRQPHHSTGAPPRLDLEAILGGQWLTWIGILALFFGTAFFLGVDLGDHVLSGLPQVLIGLAVAVAFNWVGRILSGRRERLLGLGLLGGGVALLYLAAFAAYGFHQLVSLWVVFPLLLAVAVVGGVLALGRDSLIIASLTLVGAFFTPILLGDRSVSPALLPYLLAMNLGAVIMGLRKGWAGLPLGAFVGSFVQMAIWMDSDYRVEMRTFTLVFGLLAWFIFAISPWLTRPRAGFWSTARSIVTVANGLLCGWFMYGLLEGDLEHLRGAALGLLAVLYIGVTQFYSRRKGADPALRVSHDTGIALAVIALAVQLSMAWVTLAWTALGALLLVFGLRDDSRGHRQTGLAVLALVLVRSLIFDNTGLRHPADFRPLLNGEFLAGLAVIAVLGWSAWMYRRIRDRLSGLEARLTTPLLMTALCVLFWKISFEVLAIFARQQALGAGDTSLQSQLTLSLVWAIYSAALIIGGFSWNFKPLRVLGIALLGLTVVKVFLLDIHALDQGYRIVAFVALGLLLLAVSVLYQRRKGRAGEPES